MVGLAFNALVLRLENRATSFSMSFLAGQQELATDHQFATSDQ